MPLTPSEQGQLLAMRSMADAITHQIDALLGAHAPPEADPPGAADPAALGDLPPLTFMRGGIAPADRPPPAA